MILVSSLLFSFRVFATLAWKIIPTKQVQDFLWILATWWKWICHMPSLNAGAKFQQQTNHCNGFSPTRLWPFLTCLRWLCHVTVSVSGVERAEEVSAVLLSKAPWVAPPCVRCCTALGVRSMSFESTTIHQLTVCCGGSCCRVAHPWPISMFAQCILKWKNTCEVASTAPVVAGHHSCSPAAPVWRTTGGRPANVRRAVAGEYQDRWQRFDRKHHPPQNLACANISAYWNSPTWGRHEVPSGNLT